MGVRVEPVTKPVQQLIESTNTKKIVLPMFQREFVWHPDDVVLLLDSILKGYSISSMLFLEKSEKIGIKPFEDGPEITQEDFEKIDYIVLDGQQRLTGLLHSLELEGDGIPHIFLLRFYTSQQKPDEKGLLDLLIENLGETQEEELSPEKVKAVLAEFDFLDLLGWKGTGIRQRRKDEYKLSGDNLGGYIPLQWIVKLKRRAIIGKLEELYEKEKVEQCESFVDPLITALRDSLINYPVPVVVIKPEATEKVAINVLASSFNRVNRTGMSLGAFDLAVAKYYNIFREPNDLRSIWKKSAKDNEFLVNVFGLDGFDVLQVIALSYLSPSVKEVDVFRYLDKNAFVPGGNVARKEWDESMSALIMTVKFLFEELGIKSKKIRPNKYIYLVISALYLKIKRDGGWKKRNLNELLDILKIWVWSVAIDPLLYPRGPNWPAKQIKIITEDVKDLDRLKEKLGNRFCEAVTSDDIREIIEDASGSIISRLCITRSPNFDVAKEPWDEQELEVHHFFPKSRESENFVNSAFNLLPVVKKTNKELRDRPPEDQLSRLEVDDEILESFMLPSRKQKKLLRNPSEFISWRITRVILALKEIADCSQDKV